MVRIAAHDSSSAHSHSHSHSHSSGGGLAAAGGGNSNANVARRRSLESHMKETGTRTKVVLRHLPPSLSPHIFQDQFAHKYAGAFTWCSFHPGKTSHKHQVHSRAYINFKKPEDVIDFYEDFNGHIFVNERGAQYKATVEYAPYQRMPKPRSKKDVREATISKDPEYLEFLEQLDKPTEYLPSAEIQLERREAEKAASLASGGPKDSVIVTPLMEYVRLRRAAKSAPQRGMSASSKLARSAGTTTAYSLSSQKRTSEKGRSGPTLYIADSTPANKEGLNHALGPRREEQQRKEREILIERKRKETTESKEKKLVREAVAAALSSTRANTSSPRAELSKERTVLLTKDSIELSSELTSVQILTLDGDQSGMRAVTPGKSSPSVALLGDGVASGDAREGHKREVKKKHLLLAKEKDSATEAGQGNASSNSNNNGGASNQRHRSSASGKVSSGLVQQQQSAPLYRAASPVETAPTSKQSHRRDSGGRASPRGTAPHSQSQSAPPAAAVVDPQTQAQSQPTQVEKGGKRPPRPQAIRLAGKEQAVSLMNSSETESGLGHGEEKSVKQIPSDVGPTTSLSERQDSRRLRNKDRPDRPVWTPRRREGVTLGAEAAMSSNGATAHPVGVSTVEAGSANAPTGTDFKGERGNHGKHAGRYTESRMDSQQGSGTGSVINSGNAPSGKTRYVEAGNRNLRGGNVVVARDMHADSQFDMKNETASIDGKSPSGKQTGENGDVVVRNQASPQLPATEDRKKSESPFWNESGGGHRQGGRRERNGQQLLKESEGGITGTELANKISKRGRGPLALGSNEKQVWVAVQKTVTGS